MSAIYIFHHERSKITRRTRRSCVATDFHPTFSNSPLGNSRDRISLHVTRRSHDRKLSWT